MAIFNQEDFEKQDALLRRIALGSSLSGSIDDEQLDNEMADASTDVMSWSKLPASGEDNNSYLQRKYEQGISAARYLTGSDDVSIYDTVELPETPPDELTGSNMSELLTSDPEWNQRQRRDATFQLMRLQSSDFAIGQKIDRWRNRDLPELSPELANKYARDLGADIKFDKPKSSYEVKQAVDTYLRRQELQNTLAKLNTTGSYGFAQDAVVMASGIAGAVGPGELATSIALGVAIPEVTIASISKAGQVVPKMLKLKRVADAAKEVRTAKTLNMIAEGVTAPVGSEARTAVSVILKNSEAGVKAAKIEERNVKAMQILEKMEKLKYNSLTATEKTGLDTLAFLGTDVPFINAARDNSKELGFDLYSEQDKAIDTLTAAGLGIFVPSVFRGIGRALGIRPTQLLERRLNNAEVDITTKEALGQITVEEAEEGRKAIATLRKGLEDSRQIYKKPDDYFYRQADDLAKVNVSNETLVAQRSYVTTQLAAGNRPKISDIPEYESIMSHIDAPVLKRLLTEPVQEVFGPSLFREISSKGVFRARVQGDTGLLGSRSVAGLSNEESIEHLGELYRGQVLRRREDLLAFKQWAARFTTFVQDLEDMYARVYEQMRVNAAARHRKGETITRKKLVNVRKEMFEAFAKYRFGVDAPEVINNIELRRTDAYMGTRTLVDERAVQLEDEFEEFYSRFVQEKDEESGTLYDFVDAEGNVDRGGTFSDFLAELKEGALDNSYLAEADDLLSMWSADKVRNVVESALHLDVSPDTDFERLFSAPRQTMEEVQRMSREADSWNAQLSVQRLEYNKLQYSPEYKPAFDILKTLSVVDPAVGSHFTRTLDNIEKIRAIKSTNYQDLKTKFIQKLRVNDKFQERIASSMSSGDIHRGIEFMFRDTLSEVLSEAGITNIAGSSRDIINTSVALFRREIQEHPEKLEAFLTPERLAQRQTIPEYGGAGEAVDASVRASLALDELTAPIVKGIDIELSRVELQAIHDVDIEVDTIRLMMDNPEAAAEILTGKATQTIYNYKGSKRNVEYLTKTSGFYTNDIRNQLRSMDASTGGQTLLDYYRDKSNMDGIVEAMVRMKHGEVEGFENSDAARVAKVILDEDATFQSSFRKFGSSYVNPSTLIKRSKLQYADAAMTDAEIVSMRDTFNASLALNPDDLVAMLPRVNELGEVRRGDRFVSSIGLADDVSKAIRGMQNSIDILMNVGESAYKKMALWGLRDFDLDTMFDKSMTSKIPLNKIRDALFTGDWDNIIDGDIQNLFDASAAVKRIVTNLVGKNPPKVDGRVLVQPDGWVYRFRTGFDDIRAVMSGNKSAAIDSFESGIHFKDADSELNAARLFGYDSIDEYIQRSFDSMFQSYYALEAFGSRPIPIVDDLINTYNTALGEDTEFAKRIQGYTSKRKGKPRPLEKFAITEGAKQSVYENVLLACGLQNSAPSAATRWAKAIQSFLSVSLLTKAGLKSLSDHATIWEGLVTNGMVEGRTEAMALAGKAVQKLVQDKDLMDLVLATSVLQQDEIFRKMANDPAGDIIKVSANASALDKFEAASRAYANFMMNDFAQLTRVTNMNKQTAGLAIQMSIGKNANTAYSELHPWLQNALLRESITGDDWDFLRIHAVKDAASYATTVGKTLKGDTFNLFIPMTLRDIPDEVFAKELARRGELNITPQKVHDFKANMITKAWNIVETSSDEMVSIPSNRIANILRGGKARNSGWSTILEMASQFQSFGAALLYNTYGRRLANFAADEVGVSVIDLFNLAVKLENVSRWGIAGSLFGMMATIGTTMLIIDSAVGALSGQIQRPITPDGKIHADSLRSAMLGSLGAGGVVLDATLEGIEGAGQVGGGFAMQIAPSFSNVLRTGYRVLQPLRSSRVSEDRKLSATGAAIAQEVARFSGLKSAPIISLVYQDLIGAWLDMKIKGGVSNYETYQNARERRGMVIMPWERNPQPIWQQLQYGQ